MTLDELKLQRRWVLWKLETVNGKPTKVPYQPNGRKAATNRRETWHTYAECDAVVSQFSGIGMLMGDGITGVDIDACCDAVSGKFSAESRALVIDLDSYSEYSPSGTGAHILVRAALPAGGIKKPYPGCKAVEIKSDGFYFTYSGRHLSKTPHTIEDRQAQITALYERLTQTKGLTLRVPLDDEEKFKRLWAGDIRDYAEDHSRADLALCVLLARRFNNNPFKVDEEFQKSGLYREKWDRIDYKWGTISKAIKGEPIFEDTANTEIEDDSPTEYLIEGLPEPMHEGWFPLGEVSLIGGSSGAGKTSWAMPMLEKIRKGESVFEHAVKPREYRVLLHDRSKKATKRTIAALGLSYEAVERTIRLTSNQQMRPPAEILEAAIEREPGVRAWFIEGLDLWIPDSNKMQVVAPLIDSLQRVAIRNNVAVLGTVGSPKQKGKDKYHGRDALFGSSSLARKVETVVLLELHNSDDPNSVRRCTVLPRNGRAERLYFEWQANGLVLTQELEEVPENSAMYRMELNVMAKYKPGDMVVYSAELGAETTFTRWRKQAVKDGKLVYNGGRYFRPPERDNKPN
jgi:hypothetical protein